MFLMIAVENLVNSGVFSFPKIGNATGSRYVAYLCTSMHVVQTITQRQEVGLLTVDQARELVFIATTKDAPRHLKDAWNC